MEFLTAFYIIPEEIIKNTCPSLMSINDLTKADMERIKTLFISAAHRAAMNNRANQINPNNVTTKGK